MLGAAGGAVTSGKEEVMTRSIAVTLSVLACLFRAVRGLALL